MAEQKDTVEVMKMIEEWGTALAIDHITKEGARGNQSEASIFGSAFKRAIARSTMKLLRADGGGLTLRPDKASFTQEQNRSIFVAFFSNPLRDTISPFPRTEKCSIFPKRCCGG